LSQTIFNITSYFKYNKPDGKTSISLYNSTLSFKRAISFNLLHVFTIFLVILEYPKSALRTWPHIDGWAQNCAQLMLELGIVLCSAIKI